MLCFVMSELMKKKKKVSVWEREELKNVTVVVCVSVGLVGVAAAVKDRRHHHHHHRSVYKKNFFPPPFGVGDGNSLSLSISLSPSI
jgi:hypothetical protein